MNPSFRLTGSALLVVSALTLSACAPLTVHSFSARGPDFARLRTYAWAEQAPHSTGDPRLDNNEFFETRLRTAADRSLTSRGFEKVSSGNPDLLLHYHASITQKLDVGDVDRTYAYCEGCRSATMYDAGTILLDLVDTRTNTLVWRGWVEASMDGVIDNQDWLEERIDQTIAKIVATIPGRI